MLTIAAETVSNPAETSADLWWLLVLLIVILVVGLTFMAAVGRLIRRIYFSPDDSRAQSGSNAPALDPWSEAGRRYRDQNDSDTEEEYDPDASRD